MMTNDAAPTVSVVVWVPRTSRDGMTTWLSIQDQTFRDLEVVVVLDDQSALTIAGGGWPRRVRQLVGDDSTPGAARNAGIRATRGRYLAFLEADDLWAVDFLERQVAYLEEHPWYQAVYADANLCGDPRVAGRRFMQEWPSPEAPTLVGLLEQRCAIPLSTLVARREAIVAAGLFDERLERCEDYDLWLRLAHRGARIAARRIVLADCCVAPGDRVADLQATLEALEQFGRDHVLSVSARQALRKSSLHLLDRLDVELAKRRVLEGNFTAAQFHLAASRQHSIGVLAARLALRVAPRAVRRAFLVAGYLPIARSWRVLQGVALLDTAT